MYPEFRILIVDDFALIRSMMSQSLQRLGFTNLEEASDGIEALEKMTTAAEEKAPYSIIFLDWNMPRMTGLELIAKCKANPAIAGIPIVMISAERETDNIVKALEAGALDFITKPFSPDVLLSKLNHLLLEDDEASAGARPADDKTQVYDEERTSIVAKTGS